LLLVLLRGVLQEIEAADKHPSLTAATPSFDHATAKVSTMVGSTSISSKMDPGFWTTG
jgi:hypothetical protein